MELNLVHDLQQTFLCFGMLSLEPVRFVRRSENFNFRFSLGHRLIQNL